MPEWPRIKALAPLVIVAANHIAVAIRNDRRQVSAFVAVSEQHRCVDTLRIPPHPGIEAKSMQQRYDLAFEIGAQILRLRSLLAFGAIRHTAAKIGKQAA